MEQRFVVKVRVTEAMCLPLSKVVLRRKQVRRKLAVRWLLVALGLGLAVMNAATGQWVLAAVLAGLCAVLAAMVVLYPKSNARRMFRAIHPDIGEMVYTFTEDKIQVEDALEDGDIQYAAFVRLVETRGQFLLFRGETQANILPKDGFCEGDAADFAAFIERRTGKTFERVRA